MLGPRMQLWSSNTDSAWRDGEFWKGVALIAVTFNCIFSSSHEPGAALSAWLACVRLQPPSSGWKLINENGLACSMRVELSGECIAAVQGPNSTPSNHAHAEETMVINKCCIPKNISLKNRTEDQLAGSKDKDTHTQLKDLSSIPGTHMVGEMSPGSYLQTSLGTHMCSHSTHMYTGTHTHTYTTYTALI